ncbi:TniQ family protein [Ornithinimicrobium panacihumi]|uniref:TniQ family protein n=1 Tax=Ornithinimicrobium panacihumi TaxID=2008449 RepID=UPI003F8C51E0
MRTDQALPVRPAFWDGESLSGYAVRLADANGLHTSALLPRGYVDATTPAAVVTRFAVAAGLTTAQVKAMTLAPMPPSIRGRGAWLRHGWRLHQDVTWICPACTEITGYRALLWRLALMPVCTRCHVLLIQHHDIPHARPAPRELLALTNVLAGLVTASVADPKPRGVLSRLRRRCQGLAATIDHQDPRASPGLPPVDVAAARSWGLHPTPDPATMATILLTAGKSLNPNGRKSRGLGTSRRGSTFTTTDRDRQEWFLTRIRQHVARDGLTPGHVPTTLPQATPRRPGQWLSLTRAAIALHMLIARALEEDDSPTTASQTLGVPDIPTCLLIDAIHSGQGLRERDTQRLDAGLEILLGEGLVDYRRRRDTLRTVTRLPRATTRQLRTPLPSTTDHPAGRLALGWIWTRFTHGPMRSSPWPQIPDREVYAFDAALDPETRLLLHDAGHQLLDGPDLTTALLTGAEVAPATTGRRTG